MVSSLEICLFPIILRAAYISTMFPCTTDLYSPTSFWFHPRKRKIFSNIFLEFRMGETELSHFSYIRKERFTSVLFMTPCYSLLITPTRSHIVNQKRLFQ